MSDNIKKYHDMLVERRDKICGRERLDVNLDKSESYIKVKSPYLQSVNVSKSVDIHLEIIERYNTIYIAYDFENLNSQNTGDKIKKYYEEYLVLNQISKLTQKGHKYYRYSINLNNESENNQDNIFVDNILKGIIELDLIVADMVGKGIL